MKRNLHLDSLCVCSPIALGNLWEIGDLHNGVHMSSQSTLLTELQWTVLSCFELIIDEVYSDRMR